MHGHDDRERRPRGQGHPAARRGPRRRPLELASGDVLLLEGPWAAIDDKADDPGILVVDPPELVRRQSVPLGLRAWEALAVLAGMIVLLVTGVVPPAVAGLLAAGTIIVLRIVTIEGAYRSITWTTVVLVAAMLPLSTAMFETGAADLVGGPSSTSSGASGRTGCWPACSS